MEFVVLLQWGVKVAICALWKVSLLYLSINRASVCVKEASDNTWSAAKGYIESSAKAN